MPRKGQRDEIWDVLAELFWPSGVTKREQKHVGMLVRDFKEKHATAVEIRFRHGRYVRLWPGMACTADALLKNWDLFAATKRIPAPTENPDMVAMRQQAVAIQQRRAVAQKIVDRHTEDECVAAWDKHVSRLGKRAKYYVKMRKALPESVAELLEPGELDRMMDV